jgi:hypothetical protein
MSSSRPNHGKVNLDPRDDLIGLSATRNTEQSVLPGKSNFNNVSNSTDRRNPVHTALSARIFGMLLVLAATPSLAQSAGSGLDQLLARSLGGASAGQSSGTKLHDSPAGHWMLQQDPNTPGLSCAITFHSKPGKGTILGFLGPSDNTAVGAILFVSPQIPKAAGAKQTTVRLDTAGDPSQNVRATHLPHSPELSVLAVATEMKSTVSAIDDVETVTLHMGGNTVFQLDYQGGHAARDALLKCMAASKTGQ